MKNWFSVPLRQTISGYAHPYHVYNNIYQGLFTKETCIICQSSEGILNKVAFASTGEKILDIAKKNL